MIDRLNKRTVDEATYQGPGGCYIWDTELSCFGLRIYPTGRKSFVVSYWSRGRRRFYTLGQYGRMTVKQARDSALEVFLRVRQGEDPSRDRRADIRAPTVANLADRHIEEHAKVKNKARSVKRARQLWDRSLLPKLGKRKVADVGRADIAKLMVDMSGTPAMANKALTLLSKAFNLAEVWGWRPEGTNPCRHVERFSEESRERFLSEPELKRLGEVLCRYEETSCALPQAIAAIRLLIFTGCRSAEILGLKWDEVNFERRTLELPDSKTGRKTVVLNTAAIRVLEKIERVTDNPYAIPGGKRGQPLSTLQPLWNRIRVDAKIEDVRIHDLRHHFASHGVNTGHNLAVIGKLLGHSKIATTQRYAHLADDPLRRANEEIGSDLEAGLLGEVKNEELDYRSASSMDR